MEESELEHIQLLCAAASAEPWRSFIEGRDHWGGSDFIQTSGDGIELIGATHADQDFIANARQSVPRLIDEVRRLRARVSQLEAMVPKGQ